MELKIGPSVKISKFGTLAIQGCQEVRRAKYDVDTIVHFVLVADDLDINLTDDWDRSQLDRDFDLKKELLERFDGVAWLTGAVDHFTFTAKLAGRVDEDGGWLTMPTQEEFLVDRSNVVREAIEAAKGAMIAAHDLQREAEDRSYWSTAGWDY